jgi:hypothetical protein
MPAVASAARSGPRGPCGRALFLEQRVADGLRAYEPVAEHKRVDPVATADRYELVAISEARHDMSRPVDALRAARRILQDGGSLLVADERVDDEFTAPAPLLERHAYGWSVISCLPNAMNAPLTAATGVTRPSTLRRYATAAGSSEVHVLLIGLLVTPAAAGAHGSCGIYDTATAAPDGHHIVESHYNYEAAARPGRLGLGGDHLHLQR